MKGSGWFDDFHSTMSDVWSGFKLAGKTGLPILGAVADALGQSEIGVPLQIVGSLMD